MKKEYASYFVSFLLNSIQNKENIHRIILFGSVAKDDATKESDVDIFIEVKKKTKIFNEEIDKIEKEFYQSREFSLFSVKGINNKFNVKILRQCRKFSRRPVTGLEIS